MGHRRATRELEIDAEATQVCDLPPDAEPEHTALSSVEPIAVDPAQAAALIGVILAGCRVTYWSDVQGSKVQWFISTVRAGKKPASAQTQNYYLRDFKSFCRWAVADGRLNQSPVEHLRPLPASRVRNDRRHERRVLSVDEATRLLNATAAAPERHGMAGQERAMLYRLAIETGLRASEMRSLTRASFELESAEPTVTVQAADTKNRDLDVRRGFGGGVTVAILTQRTGRGAEIPAVLQRGVDTEGVEGGVWLERRS